MKIQKVLVTGGAGCIGYQVCKLLEKKKLKLYFLMFQREFKK